MFSLFSKPEINVAAIENLWTLIYEQIIRWQNARKCSQKHEHLKQNLLFCFKNSV